MTHILWNIAVKKSMMLNGLPPPGIDFYGSARRGLGGYLKMRRIGSALLVLAVLFSSASCRQTIWVPPFGLPGFDGEESVTYVAYHEGGDYEMINETYQVTVKGSDGSITTVDMPAETTGGLKTVTVPGYKNLTLNLYFADYVISTPEQWLAFSNSESVCDYGILTGDIIVNFTARTPYENDNSTIYSTSQENTVTFTGTAIDGQAALFISADNVLLDGFTVVSQIEDMNAVKVTNGDSTTGVSTNVELRNMIIDGADVSKYVNFHQTKDCKITNCTIQNIKAGFNPNLQIASSENLIIDGLNVDTNAVMGDIKLESGNADYYWPSDVTMRNLGNIKRVSINNSGFPDTVEGENVVHMEDSRFESNSTGTYWTNSEV